MAAGFKVATVNAASVSTQTDFPSYVDLSRLGITTLAEAQSVRVYADSSKTTEWAREIVSATEMHVKIPSLTSTTDIYIDWDGVSADYAVTDTYGRNAVWSDYVAVYHLEGNSNDSTVNALNGSDTSVTYGTSFGVLGGQGADFDGSASIINLGNSSLMNFDTPSYTIQSWAQPQANAGLLGIVSRRSASAPNAGYGLGYDWTQADGFSFVQRTTASVNWETNSGFSSSINNWYHVVGVYNAGGNSFCYVDATSGSLNTSTRGSISSTQNTYISALQSTSFKWNGYIDELRLRTSALSANWITTEYNNQSDEAGFWGTWSDVGGGATAKPSLLLMGVGS